MAVPATRDLRQKVFATAITEMVSIIPFTDCIVPALFETHLRHLTVSSTVNRLIVSCCLF